MLGKHYLCERKEKYYHVNNCNNPLFLKMLFVIEIQEVVVVTDLNLSYCICYENKLFAIYILTVIF